MLKSFEYIDPILAQKIYNLESQLKKVQQSRNEIMNNSKLTQATREKLLKYQTECSNNIEKMLNEEKDKLAQYLDQQTNVITKTTRLSTSRTGKANVTLNQSTRLQFQGTDDSRSLDATKTDINRKISSFYVASTQRQEKSQNTKFPTKNRLKVRQLKKKVIKQQKLIKMLITWIKIYYQRQQNYKQTLDEDLHSQNQKLKRQNIELITRCRSLQEQIIAIRQQIKNKTLNILQTHKKYDQIKNENSGLKLERNQLLNNARSLKKPVQY